MLSLSYLSIFEALGHETRLRVFDFIYRAGYFGVRPKDIIDTFGIDSGTLDFHLKKLIAAGLIVLKDGSKRGIYCPSENIPYGLIHLLHTVSAGPMTLTRDSIASGLPKMESLH